MRLMFITGDPDLAAYAVSCGVDRIFVDLEQRGKKERQGHLDTHMASHSVEDVKAIRQAIPGRELLARVNPLYDGSRAEIEAVIAAGADFVMLPMFTRAAEVQSFIGFVEGRAGTSLLLETPQALARIDEILELAEGIGEVHIGLNDLHLGMGLDFLFEVVSGGLIDFLAGKIRAAGIRFGFGGVARVGEGAVPAELVISEHARLGSEMVILSRAFHGRAGGTAALRAAMDLGDEIRNVRELEAGFRSAGEDLLEDNRRAFQRAVRRVVHQRQSVL
jgi:hypothetical protein